MNKTYKVIYNRTRCMYQVVSELAKGRTKSETPEMLKTVFSKHGSLARGIVMAVLSMSLAMPVGVAVQAADTNSGTSGNTTSTSDTATSDATDTTTTDTTVTVKEGATLVGSGAVSVSSTTSDNKNIITISVPTNGAVEASNTGLVTGGTVYSEVRPSTDGTYVKTAKTTSENLTALDTHVNTNTSDISGLKNMSNITTDGQTVIKTLVKDTVKVAQGNRVTVSSNTDDSTGAVTYTISANNDGEVAEGNTNLVSGGTVYTAIQSETQARMEKDAELTTKIGTMTQDGSYAKMANSVASNLTALDTQVGTNTSAITNLENLSNITDAGTTVIKKQAKQAVKVVATGNATVTTTGSADDGSILTYTINVAHDGEIKTGDTNLVSGGTMYTELRPASTGTYYYISNANTTADNLIALDTNLKNVIDAIGLDADDTTTSYTSKLNKYFKVNPEVTTSTDGKTKTYVPDDAAANGTNSVAIGPSAQAGESTTDATTSTTTVTGGTSSTAIGDSAKANGDKSVALGYNSQVLNTSGSTTAVSGSTAIGNGAKVEGGSDSTALGTGATVNTASSAMALGKSATINKTATSGVAIGNGAVTGSEDTTRTVNNVTYTVKAAGGENSVAIGTGASNAGNTSIALGKGAAIENDTDGNYQAVVKSDDIAIGTEAKTSASDSSTAIGKSATVSQSTDAMAIGSSATVGASSNNAMALGKSATVSSGAKDSIAMGTSAQTVSADTIAIGQSTSATGANSVVIGKGAKTTDEGGNAIGLKSTASGYSTAIGQSATANNYNAVAIGNNATANADKSISLGYNAGVDTSEGKSETQNAGSLIAIGTSSGNNVSGMQNVAIGEEAGSNVKSSYNIAIGTQAGYGINYASDDKSQNGYNVSIGYNANYQKNAANIMYSTALGNEANAYNYSIAIGNRAKAGGAHTVAIGEDAQTTDAFSIALGRNASAADGNIAIGNGSLAPAVSYLGDSYKVQDGYVYKSTTTKDSDGNETTTWTELKSAFTYKPLASDSHYISVGNSTLTRRISNVADGVFDSDAATVGQLNSLNELLQATDTKVGLTKDYFEEKFTNLNTTIDASKTKYFSVSTSSDNLTANADNTGAVAGKADAMAIGPNANATNVKSLAVGNNVYANGLRSIAIGTAPNPIKDTEGNTTTHNTSAEGENSIALGTSTTAQADNSIAIGTRAQTYTTDTTSNTGVSAVAIGNLATTAGNQSVALGYNATVKYNYGTAIGAGALASGTDAVAVGKNSKAYSTDSMAIGQDNSITGNNVYGLGSNNGMNGKWGAIIQSGVSGYKNTLTSVSDQDTTNALNGIYMTGNNNELNQQNQYNVVQDIAVQGTNNHIYGGQNITAGHPNTLSQIAIVGSGNNVQGKSDDDGKTNKIQNVTILGYNNTINANNDLNVDFSNTQILGNNVTAALGNSVYLGNNAAYVQPTAPAQDAINAAKTKADTAAEASDDYKAAATDEDKATIKAQYEAKYLYKLRVQAMEAKGTTAGMNSYNTDETYGNGTSYTYAGSSPAGVVTVGSVGSERRLQNVAAGLVSATSTDAVNGSQLYALTRQLRFGGDNSTFGTTTADDKEVVARGSNETLSIIGGETDSTKLTDNNIGVVSDGKDTLTVKLSKNVDLGTDGSVVTGNTTLDNSGLTIANGPKFTSSGIDVANKKITSVKAGEDDTDAANVGQVNAAAAAATTEVKAGTNASLGTVETNAADKHKIYTVNVDNLAVKANGTGTTVALANGINFKNGTNTTSAVDSNGSVTIDTKNLALKANGTNTATVTMDNGINFKNGTNTTATVSTDGTVTISATHNKLSTVSAATGDNDNVTLTLTDADGNTVTSTDLKNTYTTVTKDGTAHTVAFARNDGTTQTLSLGDLDGASKGELATAAAKATTQVIAGANVSSVDDTNAGNTDGPHVYKVNVSNLGVKVADGQKKSVALSDGLVFGNGTNTTASVGDNGAITFNISNEAIKTQAKDAINMTAGSNVKVETATSTDGLSKTFTISATHNTLKSATLTKGANDVSTLTITGNDGDTTSVDIKNTYLTVSKDPANKTVTFTSNDGITPATTLSLSDFGAASTTDMTAAVAKATTEVKAGTNVTLGTLGTDPTDQHKIYIVNVDNLGVSQNGIKVGTGVFLKNGLNFTDGTNTTASVAENGTVSYSVSNDAIKAQAKNAVMVAAGDNVSIDAPTDVNNVKTYTVKVNDLKLQANGEDKGTRKLAEGINFANGKNITAAVEDGKVVYSLNDALTDLTSVTAKDTTGNQTLVSGSGVTITSAAAGAQPISLTTNGLSMGNQQITHVQSGGDTDTNAANISDVKRLVQASASGTTETGFKVKGDDTTSQTVKLGKQLNVVGGVNDSSKLSNGNIGVVTAADGDGNATLTVKLNKDITLDSVKTGNTTLNTSGVTNGNMSLTGTGMTITDTDANKQVSVTTSGVSMGGNVIHNVGNGIAPTDAVNMGQLGDLQKQVRGGWNLSGNNAEGTAVTAQIGAGKTVTYGNGNYTKAVVTKDDTTGNATVNVDVTTGTFGSGTGDKAGTVTSTANGLATTQDVANAINSASINVVADNTPDNKTSVKAGETIHFAKDDNLTLTQNGTIFTYGLNQEIKISKVTTSDTTKGSTVQTAEGITTTDAAGNTYIQNGQGITLTPSDKTKSPVKLTNGGLDNGGNKITGVGKGTDDTDAVNVAQLKEVNDKVGSGWQLAGNDGQKVADIGAGKKVSFKTDSQYLTAKTESAGTDAANVTYGLKTKALTVSSDGKVSSVETAEDGLATAKNVAETINQTYWTVASGKSGSGSQADETANAADKQISAGDTVTFNAGNNLSLVQNGASFTYGLQADLTGMNTITFTPRTDDKGHPISLVIGKQKDGVSTDEGYYITGLDNTTWNQSNYVKDRAATEAQLASAIQQVTLASQSGGFKLSDDQNQEVSQVLGQAIGVVGDGNITTTAETTTADTNGHIRIHLNNTLDLTEQGSVTIGSSTLSNGRAKVGKVVVNGTDNTVSGLSNTEWNVEKAAADGYKGSNKAATESQLQTVYNQATKTASENELHTLAKKGGYTVDDNHQVSMDVVNGKGEKQGSIVINDVAKASEVGTVRDIAKDLQNKTGDTTKPTSVVDAINNLNDKVGDKNYLKVEGKEIANGDSATTAIGKLNNRMNDIYQTAGQHTTVSNTDKNLDIKPTTDDKGKTNYEINLSKQVNLGDVKFDGEKGSIEAKSVKADSFTSGSTVVNNDGVQVGKGTALTSDSLKVGGNTYVDNKGLNANGTAIRNIGDGKENGDAVNMKQLNEVKSDYQAADAKLDDEIRQTNAGLNEVGRAVNKLGNRLNRVGAGAAALAALHPGTYDPNDKWDFSAGVGHYHDANAVAIGAYYHPNDTTILSIGGSMGGGENMVNAGITWKMGRSGREQAAQPVVVRKAEAAPVVQQAAPVRPAPVVTPAPVTTPALVKSVASATPVQALPAVTTPMMQTTTGDTAALAQILARQTAILEKLAQNQAQAAPSAVVAHGDDIFPDVPDNHWAYAYVAKLEKAGALKGFKRPAVLKSPMMTRDDFASVLYTAMANGATTNPALNGDDSLNRLAQEFKAELKNVKA